MANTKVTSRVIADNSVGITQLNVSDGTDGQVLKTNGAGTLSFGTVSGASSINDLSDAKTFGTGSIMMGDATTGTIDAANYNTGFGIDVFEALTSGDDNVAIGYQAGTDITTGSQNVFLGKEAGHKTTTGTFNTGLGHQAYGTGGGSATTGQFNTAIGYAALYSTTSASSNTAVGKYAMLYTTTGGNNVAVGAGALQANTSGVSHTAVGHQALDACTTGNNNTAFGKDALGALTTGGHNVACGLNALVAQTTSNNCTAMGSGAGFALTTSDKSTLIGREAGVAVTTGSNNTLIGGSAGYNITTGTGNTILGTNSHASAAGGNYQIVIGYNVLGVGDNYITMGSSTGSDRIYLKYDVNASWTRASDERYKEEIQNNTDCGLDFINDLRPVTFKWKPKADIDNTLPDYDENKTERHHDGKMYGLIAQEVKQALEDNNITDFGGWSETSEGVQGISQEMFVHPLIKAVQELSAKCDSLQKEINELKGK